LATAGLAEQFAKQSSTGQFQFVGERSERISTRHAGWWKLERQRGGVKRSAWKLKKR
jgi:hypothetical protein